MKKIVIDKLYEYHPSTLDRRIAIQRAMTKEEIIYGQAGYQTDDEGNIRLATQEEIWEKMKEES